ncbi:hypothetical protein AMS68_003196 [Peltaster fructicola]|uniref:Cytochrome P450 n=1 Tax=Peltaster fructicola TaxID=286661 RepID=A0A6H0XST6_9PEZI|nr:hypothetical protein AMS68_003196 [Peltaster fructicola]
MAWISFTESPILFTIAIGILVEIAVLSQAAFKQIYSHPLTKYPGPKLGFLTTYRKAWIELVLKKSWHLELQDLHKKYGPIVRVGPNELHFEQPQAYHDIYNNSNRWDKEESLYGSFGEDRSSFGFLTYKESKARKDVLNKSFSTSAMSSVTPMVQEKIDSLCDVFTRLSRSKEPVDLNWAFRCMTMDVITYLSFGRSVDAIHAPGFEAPILVAMDASAQVFVAFKHFSFYKDMILNCPPNLSKKLSPAVAGLVDLQQILGQQIMELVSDPTKIEHLPHNNTIYHSLLNPEAYKNGTAPDAGSLYEESQALMFAGADTVGITLMYAMFHLLKKPKTLAKVKQELVTAWPDIKSAPPALKDLEKLPYFNATIKEALRLSVGVISGLPRITPEGGAVIVDQQIPEDTIVSTGAIFVHYNPAIFPDPHEFRPERWLADASLDNWLVAFSRGPRSCLGINLAWLELRLTLAAIVRRFDFELDPSSPDKLVFRDCFLPAFQGPHVKALLTPLAV